MGVDYAGIAAEVSVAFEEVAQGIVTMTRITPGEPNVEEPWLPVAPSKTELFRIEALVNGVSAKLVNGTTIVATDLELTCADKMVLIEVDGDAVAETLITFDIDLADTIQIDGKPVTVIQHTRPVAAAGVAVLHKFILRG